MADVLAVVGTELPLLVTEDVVMPLSTDGTCEQTLTGWLWASTQRSPTRYPAAASNDLEVALVPEVI